MNKIDASFLKKSLKDLPYVVLDLETTGFEPVAAGITEVAMISIEKENVETFETLINPEMPIPPKIQKITGITDDMVKDQPKIVEVMPIIDGILEDTIFVSHNVPFDWSFLDYSSRKFLRKPLRMPSLCTLKLARRFLNLKSNKLESVANFFNIELKNAHRAMNDTKAVKDILIAFFDYLETKGIKTGQDLVEQRLLYPEQPPAR